MLFGDSSLQVVFESVGPYDINARFSKAKWRTQHEGEIAVLDAKCRRTKRINNCYELLGRMKAVQRP